MNSICILRPRLAACATIGITLLTRFVCNQVITDETFKLHQGFDLATFDDRTVPATELPSYRVAKAQPFVDFRAQLAREHGYRPEEVRLWVLVNRQNKTVRPDAPVMDSDPTMSTACFIILSRRFDTKACSSDEAMETVRDKMASRQHDLKLYLEYISPETKQKVRSFAPELRRIIS